MLVVSYAEIFYLLFNLFSFDLLLFIFWPGALVILFRVGSDFPHECFGGHYSSLVHARLYI